MTERNLQRVGVVALLLTLGGCGGAYNASVSGTVTLDGNTVPRGTVTYHPTAGGPAAYAPIRDDGTYTIYTGREQGLPAGEYQVTVAANEAAAQLISKDGGPMPAGKAITPAWYRSKDTSGLKFNVASGSNEINLDLKSQPPAGWNPGRQR